MAEPLVLQRLDRRAADEGLSLALAELRRASEEIEAGRVYQGWELIELGRHLELASYSEEDE